MVLVAGVLMLPRVWSLQVIWWAVLVMLMLRELWVMQLVIAPLVAPMLRVLQVMQVQGAAGDFRGELAVGDVAGDGAAGDAGG